MSTRSSPVTGSAQPTMQMTMQTSHPRPAVVRVVVTGEIDLATATTLRDGLLDALRDRASSMLDVDVVGVTFLDCVGVHALLDVRNAVLRVGGRMRVSHPAPIVCRVLALTGLLDLLTAPIDAVPIDGVPIDLTVSLPAQAVHPSEIDGARVPHPERSHGC